MDGVYHHTCFDGLFKLGLRERFVCVEPGYVRGFKRLEPGGTWVGQQVLVVV
jgi:hypothetical protein